MKHKYFECACGAYEHSIRFSWFQDEWMKQHPKYDREIYIDVHFNNFLSWYQRLFIAIKYVLGYNEQMYECCMLSKSEINKMKEFLTEFDTSDVHEEDE